MYTKPGGGLEKLPSSMQTKILTVWRTLWVERKQMANPTEGTGTNQFNPATKYSGSGSYTGKQWMDGTMDSQPANEPPDFDVKFQPPLPDLTRTIEQFARACIVVQAASDTQIKQWSGKSTVTQPNFTKKLDRNGVTAAQVGRDVPATANTNTFWIIHALGAYNPATYENFDTLIANQPGYATSVSALIYNELIRDLISTTRWLDPANPPSPPRHDHIIKPSWAGTTSDRPPWVTMTEARMRLVLHEVLHYFLGGHGTFVSDHGIMNTDWNTVNCYLFTGCTGVLDDDQIRKIQKQPKPEPTGNVV